MAKRVYESDNITAIAEKMRELTGTSTEYTTYDFVDGVEEVYAAGKAVSYDSGYADGITEGIKQGYAEGFDAGNSLYLASELWYTFIDAVFPENYSLTLKMKEPPRKFYQAFSRTTNLKTVKIIFDNKDGLIIAEQVFRDSGVEVVDFTETSCKFTGNISYMFFGCHSLISIIGKLDLSACTDFTYSFFCGNLKDVEIVPNSIYYSIRFSSAYLTEKSRQSIIDGLADLTDSEPQVLTLNGAATSLTDEQKAQIAAKNWTLAY